jgi:hydrogenase/urease accessory protein HupE
MILWTLIVSGLFYGTFWGNSEQTRRNCTIFLTGFVLLSFALHLIGNPTGAVD